MNRVRAAAEATRTSGCTDGSRAVSTGHAEHFPSGSARAPDDPVPSGAGVGAQAASVIVGATLFIVVAGGVAIRILDHHEYSSIWLGMDRVEQLLLKLTKD